MMLATLGRPTVVTKYLVVVVLAWLQFGIWWKIDLTEFISGTVQLWDLDVYWQTARDVVAGQNPLHLPYMQTSGPPLVIAPYLLLVPFSLVAARGLMSALSVVAVALTAWLLAGRILRQAKWGAVTWEKIVIALGIQILCWIAFPTRFTVLLGQANLGLMFLAALLLTTKNNRLQGILSGLMVVGKTNFIVMWLTFLNQRLRIKRLVWAVATVAMVGVLVSAWLKPAYYHEYLTQRAGSYLRATQKPTTTDYYNQSLRSTLTRLGLGQLAPTVWFSLVIISSVWLFKTGNLYGGLLNSLLVSPILWSHYVVVVYPILVIAWYLVWQFRAKVPSWFWITLSLSTLLLVIEIKNLHSMPLTFASSFVASHYFVGLWLLLILVSSRWFGERSKELEC